MQDPIQSAVFQLATGETITVTLDDEGRLGSAPNLRLIVTTDRRELLMMPSSSNAVVLTTKRALAQETELTTRAVKDRDAARDAKQLKSTPAL